MNSQSSLFDFAPVEQPITGSAAARRKLSQFFMPAWCAEVLYDAHFGELGEKDVLWEPAVGEGACLAAVPSHVQAVGTEIDPRLAKVAMERTGRPVVVGNFLNVPLPAGLSAVFGNPPFELDKVERLLARCAPVMPEGSKCGLLLPAYFMQTSSTVFRFNRLWSIYQEFLPRDLFCRPEQLTKPIIFAVFTRDNSPRLFGFRCYQETKEIRGLPKNRQILMDESFKGSRSVWRETMAAVLTELGGVASLSAIYKAIEGRRPTGTTWWKEQIRKVARAHFRQVGEAMYALPAAA